MTVWDYTELASAYSSRPPYARRAMDRIAGTPGGTALTVADIGAGTGHLSVELLARGHVVDAVEPNRAMRMIGEERTRGSDRVRWRAGTGEDTGLPSRRYSLVTFGSSFNTTDQQRALRETARLLTAQGRLACVWNHRQLDDPLQAEIEAVIRRRIPGYSYGTRREDQKPVIARSELFGEVTRFEEAHCHTLPVDDWLRAWRSHATLQRQAGQDFALVTADIEAVVRACADDRVEVPYVTVGWTAERLATGR